MSAFVEIRGSNVHPRPSSPIRIATQPPASADVSMCQPATNTGQHMRTCKRVQACASMSFTSQF